jgi:hypothetical protein
MISLEDFQCSSFEKKCDWVIGYSNFIASRVLGSAKVYLYHSGNFFIEVYYSTSYKKVLMINAFNSVSGLEPYAENVSLEDLTISSL